MSGKAVKAFSNAQCQMSSNRNDALNSGKLLFTKHHWIANGSGDLDQAFEIDFERPTSLIALNIELTFNCTDSKQLLD